MVSEDIDYKGFVASLKRRKVELETELKAVDAAIHAIAVLPTPGDRLSRSAPYKGLKAQEASKRYLEDVGKPQSTSQVVQGLQDGGFTTKSENIYSIVYTALKRQRKNVMSGIIYENRKWSIRK